MSERELKLSDQEIERLLFADAFASHWCTTCSSHPALFVTMGEPFDMGPGSTKLLGLCPSCVTKRIAAHRARGGQVPEWLSILEGEARREVAAQAARGRRELEVSWDDLFRCHRCGAFIRAEDARYPRVASGGSPAHCIKCFEAVRLEDTGTEPSS